MKRASWALPLALSVVLLALGCAPVGDPGYGVIFKNDSDRQFLIRGDRRPGVYEVATWLLPPQAAGWVLYTIGDSRVAPPIAYSILDASSCEETVVQRVDFSLAPDPGWTEFLITVSPDGGSRLDASPNAAGDITGDLAATNLCPVK
jgi:hypothetical protein